MPLLSTTGAAGARAFGLFGIKTTVAGFISATGGTITTSGNYKYHTFTSSGTFSVTSAPSGRTIDYILVAGGGGAQTEAGGGGGGVIESLVQSISSGSFAVTIGTGGAVGASGNDSVFNGKTAIGGGRGNSSGLGISGGSGGGGSTGGGAALQPTSASGGYGHAGNIANGGGGGSAAASNNSGDPYFSTTFNTSYAEGGPTDTIHAGPSFAGSGGGHNSDTSTSYAGANGVLVVRYLYQ
jgi:hypothetical protein